MGATLLGPRRLLTILFLFFMSHPRVPTIICCGRNLSHSLPFFSDGLCRIEELDFLLGHCGLLLQAGAITSLVRSYGSLGCETVPATTGLIDAENFTLPVLLAVLLDLLHWCCHEGVEGFRSSLHSARALLLVLLLVVNLILLLIVVV